MCDGSFGEEGGGLFGFGDGKAEVFGLDVGLIAEDFSSFDDISEYADVSRPGVEGEELAFREFSGEGSAVDGDEGLIAAEGLGMDEPGGDFLAGAGFAGDEDGDVGGRGARDEVADEGERGT